MQSLQGLIDSARQRAINSEAERAGHEISSLLDEMIRLVGANRMNDLMREEGYNIEPDEKAKRRVYGDAYNS